MYEVRCVKDFGTSMLRQHEEGRRSVGGVDDVIPLHDYSNKFSWHRDLAEIRAIIIPSTRYELPLMDNLLSLREHQGIGKGKVV